MPGRLRVAAHKIDGPRAVRLQLENISNDRRARALPLTKNTSFGVDVIGMRYSMMANKSPASTWVPGGAWMVLMMPDFGALTVVSIFIASSTISF
ncbi:hypothetical protein Enr13x_27320 [Stieleria neptunia]|uniref:Uncharacterized protein n=1 Tax=Stieleria neptunia TaxID=2527979 RepID=A0A518HPY0_9BACT|nr:hypothetical protein Enr13x_27320 [Stieleria neptunia]